MQKPTLDGLVGAAESETRCTVACLHNAPAYFETLLREMWGGRAAIDAHRVLAAPDVMVTNKKDKEVQLEKILQLDKMVRQALSADSVSAPPLGLTRWSQSRQRMLSNPEREAALEADNSRLRMQISDMELAERKEAAGRARLEVELAGALTSVRDSATARDATACTARFTSSQQIVAAKLEPVLSAAMTAALKASDLAVQDPSDFVCRFIAAHSPALGATDASKGRD
jgi:hypothetical protein